MPNQPARASLPPTTSGNRPEWLMVVRESDMYSNVLMIGMIAQTLQRWIHLPGVSDVLALGLDPIRKGKATLLNGKPLQLSTFNTNKNRAVLFEHEGVMYLYSMGSAATRNADFNDHSNAFVELLCTVIETYRPRNVNVATFNRLIRSTEFAGRLQTSVKAHVDVLNYGGESMRPNTTTGSLVWGLLVMMAAMERDSITQRLFAGLCHKYNSTAWIFGKEAVPPGYILDPTTKKVTVDQTKVAAVRSLLVMMADKSLTARAVMDEAGRLGITSATVKRIHGDGATFENIQRADSRLASLVDWIPTYATGLVDMAYTNPFHGATSYPGLTVEGADEKNPGHVRFRYDWGLPAPDADFPDGGWATPEVLSAAKERTKGTKSRRGTGGAKHNQRKPLSGWVCWTDGDHNFHLSGTSAAYIVLRQMIEENPAEAV